MHTRVYEPLLKLTVSGLCRSLTVCGLTLEWLLSCAHELEHRSSDSTTSSPMPSAPATTPFTGMGTNNLEWYGRVGLVDLSLPKQLGARRGASLLQSGVTRKSRRTIRLGSILGGSWSTF